MIVTGVEGALLNPGAGAVLDLDGNVVAPAGTITGAIYPTQYQWEDPKRYRPAQVKPDGSVVDLDGRTLAPAGTVTFS